MLLITNVMSVTTKETTLAIKMVTKLEKLKAIIISPKQKRINASGMMNILVNKKNLEMA